MPISVVIADGQEMVRTGFRMILESQDDIEVLDDDVDGAAARDAVERMRPDVLLLDIRMPRLDGPEGGWEVIAVLPLESEAGPGHTRPLVQYLSPLCP